jgi:hypothetical protein
MHRPIVALVAVVALVSAGCGGHSNAAETGNRGFSVEADTTMTTGSLSKGAFIAKINGLCERKWPLIDQNFVEYIGTLNPRWSQERRFANAVRLSFMAGVDFHIFDEIYNLGAPEGEEQNVEKVIGAMQEAVERGQRQVRVISPVELQALFGRYNELARRYGLDECLVSGMHLPKTKLG